jgi:hypothetical protein
MKPIVYTDRDFDQLSWHDCCIRQLSFQFPDPDLQDWRSELALEIDFITEWICGADKRCRFRLAPAALVFHSVTDLKINMGWADSGFQVCLYELMIERIHRERISDQRIHLDRPYYRWLIPLNGPGESPGSLQFGAVGFTQTLLAEPVLSDLQTLPHSQRRPGGIGR